MNFSVEPARWRAGWLALACAGLFAACQSPPPPPTAAEAPAALSPERERTAAALARYSQGVMSDWNRDNAGALSNYARAVELDPDNEDLHFRVAMGLMQEKRVPEAVALMEALCDRHPKSERALLWLALVYRAAERPDQALRAYDRALKAAPGSPVPYIEKASLLTKLGRGGDALALLNRGVDRVDKPSNLLQALGEAYLSQMLMRPGGAPSAKEKAAALRLYEKATRLEPDNLELVFQLGDLYALNGEMDKAIACFQRIEASQPADARVQQRLAASFAALGDKKKAIAVLEDMAQKNPSNPRVFYYLGELYEQLQQRDDALVNYSLATKSERPEAAAYLKMAVLYMDEGKTNESVAVLEEGAGRMPAEPRLPEMLAYIFLGQKDYATALSFFDRAQKLMSETQTRPMTANFHLSHAIAAQLAGETSEAASLLYHAMGVNRAYLDAYIQYVFQENEDTNLLASVRVLDKLGERSPSDPHLFVYLGLLNSYAKLYPASIAAFEKAERLAEDAGTSDEVLTGNFYFWFGAACEREGQFDRAEALFLRCVEIEPEHEEAHNYLAYMLAERDTKLDLALEHIQKALAIDPKNAAYLDTLGWIYFMQERFEDALAQIESAAQLMPDDPTIADHLGDVLDKLGRDSDALEQWKRAFILDPENAKVAEKLGRREVDLSPLRAQAAEVATTLKEKKARQKAEKKAEDQEHPDPVLLEEPPAELLP